MPVGDEGTVSGVHSGQFPGSRLKRLSPCFNFPGCLLHCSSSICPTGRDATHPEDLRRTSGGTSSPGIRNFVTFPAWASRRAGECCKGPSRKCGPGFRRTRQTSLGARTTGEGAPTIGPGECPCPPRRPVGGRFPLLPATLCRRSPAPDMGAAAAAVGPRAGFRARVVSAGPRPL